MIFITWELRHWQGSGGDSVTPVLQRYNIYEFNLPSAEAKAYAYLKR